jgi:hypothetical protein
MPPRPPQVTGREIAGMGLVWAQTGLFRRAVLVDATLLEEYLIAREEGQRFKALALWLAARSVAEYKMGRLRRRKARRAERERRRKTPVNKGKPGKKRREWLGGLIYWE